MSGTTGSDGIAPGAPVDVFATDLYCLDDLDPLGAMVTGITVLEQSVVRGLSTPRGSLLDAPDRCIDLSDWIAEDMDARKLAELRAAIVDEVESDERIIAVVVSQFEFRQGTLTIDMTIDSSLGPFSLNLAVSDTTVTVLRGNT